MPRITFSAKRVATKQNAQFLAASARRSKAGPSFPSLVSPNAGTPVTLGTGNFGVTTDYANGTLFWAVVTNGGSATSAQIIAGTGGSIVPTIAGSQAVTTAGVQTITSLTGLIALTTYQILFVQRTASGILSTQSSVTLSTTV